MVPLLLYLGIAQVEVGEIPQYALQRELYEELGVEVSFSRLFPSHFFF